VGELYGCRIAKLKTLNIAFIKDIPMKNIDLTPIMASLVGADKLFQNIPAQKIAQFPPHNLELISENDYLITLAVAGYSKEELAVEVEGNTLTITGKKIIDDNAKNREFLHKGIGERDFVKRFTLGEYIEVTGSGLENGLLSIKLEKKVPEEKLPRAIEIT